MQKSKLIEILKRLTPKQIRSLDEFIRSPFFNKNENAIQLFKQIKKHCPSFNSKKLERHEIFETTFPKMKFDEKKLGYLHSDLVKMTEKFLAYSEFEKSTSAFQLNLLKAYNDLELDKQYKSTMAMAENRQRQNPHGDADYYFQQYNLAALENDYFNRQRKRHFDENLQAAIDNFDLYYISQKLKYSCEIANRQNVLSAKYRLRLLEEILSYLKNNPLEDVPVISIYYHILMTLIESENEQHYIKLKELLVLHVDKFPKEEARDMYTFAINYCIKKANKGESQFLIELFELYKTALQLEVIFDGRFISPWTFKNIVGAALRVEEFEWANNFIKDYKNKIRAKFRENAFLYNLASLHFARKEFSKAQELLNQVEFTDVFYATDSKALLIRIYYELGETEPLISLLDSFYTYLNRNKLISKSHKLLLFNLIKFVRKLVRIYQPSRSQLELLKSEIEETKQVAYIGWILKKVEEQTKNTEREVVKV